MKIGQIDREAVNAFHARSFEALFRSTGPAKRHINEAHQLLVQAFARHRIAERERVVAEICEWLRDYPAELYKRDIAYTIAYKIEVEFGGRDDD